MTVTEGAAILDAAGDKWVKNGSSLSIWTVTTRAAKKLSKDPIFNAAAYLKHDCCSMSGVTDEEWIQIAKQAKKILED